MTTKNVSNKFKSNLILVLTIIGLLCVSLFGLISCNDGKTSDVIDPSTYTSAQETDSLFTNSDFTAKADAQNFSKNPIITTVTGWSRTEDNAGGRTSRVNSGVIDVSDEGWESLLKYLYNDSEFNDYMENKFDYDNDKIKELIKEDKGDDSYSPTSSEIKNYVIENYYKDFLNPGKYSDDVTDNNVYMLNNYLESVYNGIGTAQKIASNSVALEADSYYQISVWVKTSNISGNNADNNYGANIRIVSNVGGKAQEDVKVTNIISDEWQNFNFYLKTDADHSCTVTLNLGLGFGGGDYDLATQFTEGTLFVDGISFKKLESTPTTSNCEIINLEYASEEDITFDNKTNDNTNYFYNMEVVAPTGYFSDLSTSALSGRYTSKRNDFESFSENKSGNEYVATLENTSATIKIESDKFLLDSEEYVYITFDLKADFSKFGSTDITVDIFDILGNTVKKRAAVNTIVNVGEYVKYGVMVKNNFTEVDNRTFYLELIIGPTAISDVTAKYEYATATVSIKNVQYATGKISEDAENYDFYSLYAANALVNSALYAGYSNDYTADHVHGDSYSISANPGNIGDIVSFPTDANGYDGIVSNHIFIIDQESTTETLETEANTRSGKNGDGNGNYAGLINSNYVENYNIPNLVDSLDYVGENAIQPLMIYNSTADHYGFISTGSKKIVANAYAKISVDVRVIGNAKAYIYIVNNSTENKNVVQFKDFTVNTDVVENIANGTQFKGSDMLLEFCIDSNVMAKKAVDGWVTVTFYIAAGASAMDFRVELWNGGRDGSDATESTGFVFFNNISTVTTSGFTESTNWRDTFSISGNPLYDLTRSAFGENDQLIAYQRELTDKEKQYNKDYPSNPKTYETKYIWAKTSNFLYAIYNTLDVTEVDPYASIVEDETQNCGSNCQANTDPSTFWLSFSSIVLGAILVLAIIALILKRVLRRRKANASDAKSHYKITSRITTHNNNLKKKASEEIEQAPVEQDNVIEEVAEENNEEEISEESLDDYVYGDVEEFDQDSKSNEADESENSDN